MNYKIRLIIILIISINSLVFSERYLIQDYSGTLNNKFAFNFSLDNVYESKITYNFEINQSRISPSKPEDIFVYFNFYLPDFSITYRYTDKIKNKTYIEKTFDSFILELDNYILLSLKDLYIGVSYVSEYIDAAFWVELFDLKNSLVDLTLKPINNMGLSFNFEENGITPFYFIDNMYFSLKDNSLNKVYFLYKKFYLKYDRENNDLRINSLFFDLIDNKFKFRFPISDYLFFLYTDLGIGISLMLPI